MTIKEDKIRDQFAFMRGQVGPSHIRDMQRDRELILCKCGEVNSFATVALVNMPWGVLQKLTCNSCRKPFVDMNWSI